MIRTAAPSPQTQGAVPDGNPFLFSYPGGDPVDLRPALEAGANIAILSEALPAEAGPLYAKHSRRGKRISRPTALYYRLYRWLKSRVKSGLLKSEKGVQEAGLGDRPSVWYTTSITALGLIRQVQNSNRIKPKFAHRVKNRENPDAPPEEWPKWLRVPQRCSTLRVVAAKLAMGIRTQEDHYMFIRPDPEHLHPDLIEAQKPIQRTYENYVDQANEKRIILVNSTNPDEYLVFPYRTRFNDRHRQLCNLDQFEAKFKEAEEYYDAAVFLTLTTDPAMHPNLWWANRHMGRAFNRYMSLLTKRNKISFKNDIAKIDAARMKENGYSDEEIEKYQKSRKYRRSLNRQAAEQNRSWRPRYLCCNEFQENGLIHSHIMIFGRSWLALKSQIREDWIRCGQGQIVDVCAVRHNGDGWTWTKERPKDAKKDEDAKTYLKKYLNKAIYDHKGFEYYFTINKRFFTASRSMSPAKQERPPRLDYQPAAPLPSGPIDYVRPDPPRWEFGGCVPASQVPAQVDFVAKQCRRKYCSRPDPIWDPMIPAEMMNYEAAAEADRRRDRARKARPSPFIRAADLPRSDQPARPPEINPKTGRPFTLADFM